MIDFEEFITGLALFCRGTMEQKIKMLFDMYDLGSDGFVTRVELKTMLLSLVSRCCLVGKLEVILRLASATDHADEQVPSRRLSPSQCVSANKHARS